MRHILYHYTETPRKLLRIIKAGAIGLAPFRTYRAPEELPHILLSADPDCDMTAHAVVTNVYEQDFDYDVEEEIRLYRIRVWVIGGLMPWKKFKRDYDMSHPDLEEEEREVYGDKLDKNLRVSTKPIPWYQWFGIEQLMGRAWVPVLLHNFIREFQDWL